MKDPTTIFAIPISVSVFGRLQVADKRQTLSQVTGGSQVTFHIYCEAQTWVFVKLKIQKQNPPKQQRRFPVGHRKRRVILRILEPARKVT